MKKWYVLFLLLIAAVAQAASGTIEAPFNDVYKATYRPFLEPAAQPTTVYLETTGDDTTCDGTVSKPCATISKGFQLVGQINDGAVIFQLGAGIFASPNVVKDANNITFRGTTSITETRNITSVVAADTTDGIVVTVDGSVLADDAWRGSLIQYVSGGSLNNNYGWVYHNIGNTLYLTQEQTTAIIAPTTSDDIRKISLDSTVQFTGTTSFLTSTQANYTLLNMTGTGQGRVLFINATDKFELSYVKFTMNYANSGTSGAIFFRDSYIASQGDSALGGVLRGANGGFIRLERGTVVDASLNAATGERYVRVGGNSYLQFKRMVVFRGLESNGVMVDGGSISIDDPSSGNDFVLFDDAGGTATNTAAFRLNMQGAGVGGSFLMPKLQGTITDNYSVVAQRNAYGFLLTGCGLTDATGTCAVSADGGSTNSSSNADGTLIVGGSPP